METLLEAARHGLEGVEVLFAFATAAALSVGLAHAHHAARHPASDKPAAGVPDSRVEPLNRAA
ncbi:MAG TPA: hypothetical protein VFJ16_22000 [Longimicrobium sp.]|nr:hypothetical protein [Longimicrobium sp.]